MINEAELIPIILESYPNTQAIYLFGSWGTEDEWPSSDVDIAVLLPPKGDVATLNWTHSLKLLKEGVYPNESRETQSLYSRI